jgi:5-methylcytosine-specific restriction protein A
MPRLTTLKPRVHGLKRRLAPPPTASSDRPRGRQWMETRSRVALAYEYRCVDCGRVWVPWRDQIDHDTPRHLGGSDDDSNLKPRCDACHKAKSAKEAVGRAGGAAWS